MQTTLEPRLEVTFTDTLRAWAAVGGLSNPSKMPGFAWGISARHCITGSKLRVLAGSTCNICYALKGNYLFPRVTAAQAARLGAISTTDWIDNMVTLLHAPERYLCTLAKKKQPSHSRPSEWFRWFDSGDLQNPAHWDKIQQVIARTPHIHHWLPTREPWMRSTVPEPHSNLVVRWSPPMIDGIARAYTSSMVYSGDKPPSTIYQCPAPRQQGECRDCRACWNPKVSIVGYKVH